MVAPAKAGTRHIILFADAADSRQHPGELPSDSSTPASRRASPSPWSGWAPSRIATPICSKDIARRAGGQCMFTNVAQELPRLFAQDTCVIARSAFIERADRRAADRRAVLDHAAAAGRVSADRRLQPLLSPARAPTWRWSREDEYKAPVLALWQAGLGRVLCYAGEADGKYTGPMAGWGGVGDFFTSLARWTAGKSQGLGPGVVATQELRNGVCRVELHLDPAREAAPFARLPELTTLSRPAGRGGGGRDRRGWAGRRPTACWPRFRWSGSETVLPSIQVPGLGQTALAPMCLPYSPEFLPRKPGEGAAALERLAKATGGCERLNLGENLAGHPPDAAPRAPRAGSVAGGRRPLPDRGLPAPHGPAGRRGQANRPPPAAPSRSTCRAGCADDRRAGCAGRKIRRAGHAGRKTLGETVGRHSRPYGWRDAGPPTAPPPEKPVDSGMDDVLGQARRSGPAAGRKSGNRLHALRRLAGDALAIGRREHRLAEADLAGRHLDQLVVLDVLQRRFERQQPRAA